MSIRYTKEGLYDWLRTCSAYRLAELLPICSRPFICRTKPSFS